MKATYTCLMAGGASQTFTADCSLTVQEIKDLASAALKEQVIDLTAEKLHGVWRDVEESEEED